MKTSIKYGFTPEELSQSFSPWPAPQSPGGGAVIPCSFIINVKDDQQLIVLDRVQSAVNTMAERSMLKITIIYMITTTLIPRLLNVSLLLPKV